MPEHPELDYVPLSIRDKSRAVAALWRWTNRHPWAARWLDYPRARRLARWLP